MSNHPKGDTNKPVELGHEYTDRVTGFSGLATARFEFLFGCIRIELTAPGAKKGKKPAKPITAVFAEAALTDCPTEWKPAAQPERTGGPRDVEARAVVSR